MPRAARKSYTRLRMIHGCGCSGINVCVRFSKLDCSPNIRKHESDEHLVEAQVSEDSIQSHMKNKSKHTTINICCGATRSALSNGHLEIKQQAVGRCRAEGCKDLSAHSDVVGHHTVRPDQQQPPHLLGVIDRPMLHLQGDGATRFASGMQLSYKQAGESLRTRARAEQQETRLRSEQAGAWTSRGRRP